MFNWIRSIFNSKPASITYPDDVIVELGQPEDDEITKEWVRVVKPENKDMFGVNLALIDKRVVDLSGFQWQLYFSAGEFIREEPFASNLSQTIQKSALSVQGVEEVILEDTEKFAISGELDGEELTKAICYAVDEFMQCHLQSWTELQ